MSVNCYPGGAKPQFMLSTGLPAVGYQLFSYVGGSVNTKQNTYTDSTGGSTNTNPIVLNSLGEPSTQIWFTSGQAYKVVLAPANDTDPPTSPVWTIDNLRGVNDTTVTQDQWVASALTPTYVSATQFTLVGDQTSIFQSGRRIKAAVTAGTSYGTITVSAFGAVTTITVDTTGSNPLDAGLSAISYSLLSRIGDALPRGVFIPASSNRLVNNVGLTVTMAANAATIAMKDASGADATAASPCVVNFRSSTITSGVVVQRQLTAALSTVISSGSTAGAVNAVASRICIAAIDAGGTIELAWNNVTTAPDENALITTTAEGGAGAADSAGVWYSTTARTNVAFTVLGYFESTQATAGAWATAASKLAVNPVPYPVNSYITNTLAADVLLNNTGTQFTGPTCAQGSIGTWLATGYVTIYDTSGIGTFFVDLFDGTNIIASTYATAGTNYFATVHLSGVIANPAGNIRFRVKDSFSVNGRIYANQSTETHDSQLTVIRIA